MRLDKMTFEQITPMERELLSFSQAELEDKRKDNSIQILILGLGIMVMIVGIGYPLLMWAVGEGIGIPQIIMMAAAILIGGGCFVWGISKMGKTITSTAKLICEWNNHFYTEEEIYDFFREVREDKEVIIFRADQKKTTAENSKEAGLFTEHWMMIPRQATILAKYEDIVAAWHDEKGHTEFGYMGLYILRSDGKLCGMDCHKNFSQKVMEEIGKRNPLTILARRFSYEGNTYDVCADKEQVIEIYKQNMGKTMKMR